MRADWGLWRARGAACARRAGVVVAGAAVAGLACLLAAGAAGAGKERAAVARESARLDREIGRLKARNQALRDEVRALETDPVYVEALLRRWKRVGPAERVVE